MTVSAPADRFSTPRPGSGPGPAPSPPARRASRRGWRDPRFAVGVVLLCGSVLLGARVLASADDTVPVWAAARPLTRGQELTADDLVPVEVRFADAASADRYVAAADELPDGATLGGDVGAGELLPRAVLSEASGSGLVEVPLSVDPAGVPSSVQVGSRVDVWVAPATTGRSGTGTAEAVRVLSDVPVLADQSTGGPATDFGTGGVPVVVGVPPSAQPELPDVLARLVEGTVVLVRRQG